MIAEPLSRVAVDPDQYAEWQTGKGRIRAGQVEKAVEGCRKASPAQAGILVGHGRTGREVRIDFSRLPNSNVLFTGSSGMGKTSQIKSMLWQLTRAEAGKPVVFVIDYNDDFVGDFAAALGRQCVVVDLASDGLPFDILELPTDSFTGQPVSCEERIEMLANHVKSCLPNLGPIQLAHLKDGMRQLYRGKRPFGDLPDVLAAFQEESPNPSISTLLAQISHLFSLNLFPERPVCSLSGLLSGELADVVVCRVKIASKPIQTLVGTFLLQNIFHFCQMRGQRHRSSTGRDLVLVLDEFHRFQGVPSLEQVLVTLLREGRKFRVSTWAATQTFSDVAEPVMTNTDTKFYFGTSSTIAAKVASALPSDDTSEGVLKKTITEMKAGEGIVSNSEIRPFEGLKTLLFHELAREGTSNGAPQRFRGAAPGIPPRLSREIRTPSTPAIRVIRTQPRPSEPEKPCPRPVDLPNRFLAFGITPESASKSAGDVAVEPHLCPLIVVEHRAVGWLRNYSLWEAATGRIVGRLSPVRFVWGIFPRVLDLPGPALIRLRQRMDEDTAKGLPEDPDGDRDLEKAGLALPVGKKVPLASFWRLKVREIPDTVGQTATRQSFDPAVVGRITSVMEMLYRREVTDVFALWHPVYKLEGGIALDGRREHAVTDLQVV